ncbi:hypothetical protein L6R52_22995, partial [Myxococcota bacterium]|nr:hypothetical protein [Myxococcota bacterium]
MPPVASIALAALVACADPSPRGSSSSSSIALDADEAALWVTSPDDDRVHVIDPVSLDVVRSFDVPGAPAELAIAGAFVVVARAGTSSVAVIDAARGLVTDVPTSCGGTRGVAIAALDAEAPTAWVTCPNDHRVLVLELATFDAPVIAELTVPGRPTAIAVSGDRVAITASLTGMIHVVDARRVHTATRGSALVASTGSALVARGGSSLVASAGSSLVAPPTPAGVVALSLADVSVDGRSYSEGGGVAASQLDVLAASPAGAFVAAFQRVDHDSDRARPPELGGYGSVIDDAPRIAPRLVADG